MPLSVYDELKLSLAKTKAEAKKWKEEAANNEKVLNVVVVRPTEKEECEYGFLNKLLNIGPLFTPIKVLPNVALKEVMNTLTEVEIINLKAQIVNLTQEKEILGSQLLRAEKERGEWKDKYEGHILNEAARQAYKQVHEIKRRVTGVVADLKIFREKNYFLSPKVRIKIKGTENWLQDILK